MRLRQKGPGEDIEAWCTKCQMDLNHRIIAVVDGRPKRVICLTCNSHHNYHPPKSEIKTATKTRVVTTPKALKSVIKTPDAALKASSEWKTFMKDYDEGSSDAKKYSPYSTYSVSEFVDHTVFGIGKVIEISGAQKVLVAFREGRKTLICNKPRASED